MSAAPHSAAHAELHETEGSLRRGWPALILTVAMIAAAIFSFSPRSYPAFEPTRVHADGFIATGLAQQDGRTITVGERGDILYTDDPTGDWTIAEVEPERGSTLTRVRFIGDGVALAVGHDGWIVRSTDAGKTWTEVAFDEDSSDPLLDIGGPYDGKLIVVGSFGQYLTSTDAGKTWTQASLTLAESDDEAGEGDDAEAGADVTDPESDDYDPFAAFASGGGVQNSANEHLNSITKLDDGALMITGERGKLLRSTDNGATWTALDEIYAGSFYGAINTPDGGILVYGMRGHAFVSHDDGKTWTASKIPAEQGLFDAAVTDDGAIILVGGSNLVMRSTDNGASFTELTDNGPSGWVSVRPLDDNRWLLAGEGGVRIEQADKSAADKGSAS